MSTLAMPGTMIPTQSQIFIPIGSVLLLGMIIAYPAVSTVRNYFRDLDVMKSTVAVDLFRCHEECVLRPKPCRSKDGCNPAVRQKNCERMCEHLVWEPASF